MKLISSCLAAFSGTGPSRSRAAPIEIAAAFGLSVCLNLVVPAANVHAAAAMEDHAYRNSPAHRVAVSFAAFTTPTTATTETPNYRLTPGDRVSITVFGQPSLSADAVIDQNGDLRLPVLGNVHAAGLTADEFERRVSALLQQGYLRNPTVSAKISEFRPVYVLGAVRSPGAYPYREGLSALAAIARAGGVGSAQDQQGALLVEALQAEERVHQLEVTRAALLLRQARLLAQEGGNDNIEFPDVSAAMSAEQIAETKHSEQRAFASERLAERQESEGLSNQIPTLQAEIESLKAQAKLEQEQRALNHQLVSDYEKMMGTGLMRKPTYIEVKREEARIDGNLERLRSDELKAEQMIGDINFRISELHNGYRRRAMVALQETQRSLLEIAVSLPAAQRIRTARAEQIDAAGIIATSGPEITVISGKSRTAVDFKVAGAFELQPGDIVQVGSGMQATSLTQLPARSGPARPTGQREPAPAGSRALSDSPAKPDDASPPAKRSEPREAMQWPRSDQ